MVINTNAIRDAVVSMVGERGIMVIERAALIRSVGRRSRCCGH